MNSRLSVLGTATFDNDVSMNSRLSILSDASINSKIDILGKAVFNIDVSMNGRLLTNFVCNNNTTDLSVVIAYSTYRLTTLEARYNYLAIRTCNSH